MSLALRLVAVLVALLATGCTVTRVAGTDDVELTYQAEAPPAPAPFGEDLRARVLRRLTAAQIGADVSEDGGTVRIVVDEQLAPAVDALVTWTGTLLLAEPDDAYVLAPRDTLGLVERIEQDADGRVDRYWEGAKAAVIRAASTWTVDRERRVLAEPLWRTASGAAEPRWRTRVVRAAPVAELADGVLVGWGEDGTLRLRVQADTPAAEVLAAVRARARGPAAREVLVRGRSSLGRPTLEQGAFVLSFGDGPAAYARAQEERRLLATPRLPALRPLGAVGLPPNTWLATACWVLPVLLSFAWLAFVRRFDRAHPEPVWLVVATFALGALSTAPAALLELGLIRLSPWLDPRLASFGGQLFALPLSFVVFTVFVGLSEEGAKLLAATFAARRPEFDEPVDGIVYGIVASLGFAAAENVRYFALSRLAAPTVIARSFMSVPAHMFFGALWGYALGARLLDGERSRVVRFLLLGAAAHGLFDALLATDGAGLLAVVLNVALASAFVVLVRRALRHGVVHPEAAAVPVDSRRYYRVGRPALFTAASVALHAFALGIFLLGAWYQLSRHRPSIVFVGGSSVLLLLLAVAAYAVSATLPLDVAVDDYGVTFAGAARPWRQIRGFAVERDRVVLECEGGPLLLGPASTAVVERMAADLRAHLGTRAADRVATLESPAGLDA